jgi:hypothetical protein
MIILCNHATIEISKPFKEIIKITHKINTSESEDMFEVNDLLE